MLSSSPLVPNKVVLHFRSTPEVLRNLRETKYGRRRLQTRLFYISGVLRKSCATCWKANTVAGDYKQGCFRFPEYSGGLAQLAGNQIRSQEITNRVVLYFRSTPEVLRNLRETKYGRRRLQTRLF